MENETKPAPSICDLWREFGMYFDLDYLYEPATYAGSDSDREYFEDRHAKRDALRGQLRDLCAVVWDADGAATAFDIYNDGSKTYVRSRPYEREFTARIDSVATADNYAAAVSFWSWELWKLGREATSTVATTQQQP